MEKERPYQPGEKSCPTCRGRGTWPNDSRCKTCKGRGLVWGDAEKRLRAALDENDALREALSWIASNAESWHKDDAAKGRALIIIAGWARGGPLPNYPVPDPEAVDHWTDPDNLEGRPNA